MWVDESTLDIGGSLEHNEPTVEDASWLPKEKDVQHINLAELKTFF